MRVSLACEVPWKVELDSNIFLDPVLLMLCFSWIPPLSWCAIKISFWFTHQTSWCTARLYVKTACTLAWCLLCSWRKVCKQTYLYSSYRLENQRLNRFKNSLKGKEFFFSMREEGGRGRGNPMWKPYPLSLVNSFFFRKKNNSIHKTPAS